MAELTEHALAWIKDMSTKTAEKELKRLRKRWINDEVEAEIAATDCMQCKHLYTDLEAAVAALRLVITMEGDV